MGPRLFAAMVVGDVAFSGIEDTNSEFFFWIPLLAPLIGGAIGGLLYLLFVRAHWEDEKTAVSPEKEETFENEFGL